VTINSVVPSGRDKKEALILIAGIEGHICELCVEQAYEISARNCMAGIKEQEEN
jgi:ATP-dependent Clp protease ATP-binding subunit ClpX